MEKSNIKKSVRMKVFIEGISVTSTIDTVCSRQNLDSCQYFRAVPDKQSHVQEIYKKLASTKHLIFKYPLHKTFLL